MTDLSTAKCEVFNHLKVGKENAVSREYLANVTGLTDRSVRNCIESLRQDMVILSLADGRGYYIPTHDDYEEIRLYRVREHHRAISILCSLKVVDALLDDLEHDRFNK